MKIVLWIGNEPNQLALANKISELYLIDSIFLETKKSKRRITVSIIIQKIIEKIFLSTISDVWFKMLSHYKNTFSIPSHIKYFDVENINSEDVYLKTKLINPDLIIVSGTRLIKNKLLSLNPKIGILNLHTGLSPYVKGGPNCTNWCISNDEFHLIGNTIMWIDKGIDSGNIVTTELTPLNGFENLLELHLKVMEHAHNLYLRAITEIINGNISSVPQNNIAVGKVFYTKEWNLYAKFKLLKNFKKYNKVFNSDTYRLKKSQIVTIKI